MSPLVINFKNKADLYDAIDPAEEAYDAQIMAVAEEIAKDPYVRILALSGPTCSGKTTTAERLTKDLALYGLNTLTVSIDDFYYDRKMLDSTDGGIDYESFAAIDSPYLAECVDRLLDMKSTMLPRYDFATGSRSGYREYVPGGKDVFVFEGIQALYPEVMSLFKGSARSIFVSVIDDAVINGVFFDKNELRLIRRLLRDYYSRSASADFTLTLWNNVRRNEETNIYPYSDDCDFGVSSYLAYETPILARALMPILSELPDHSVNYPFASHLQAKLSLLLDVSAGTQIVPEGSILREFTENAK